jgi:NAD(P)-dependent dehydrogenase (short-subunit alcohol dehydrogenase family)
MELSGKVAFVTGANRGIGKVVVDALLSAGVGRVYAGARSPGDVGRGNPAVVPIALDITNPAQVAAAAKECGDVSILVNNAGIAIFQPLLGTSNLGAARQEMDVNYFGTLEMCRAFVPVLEKNGGGAIVNVLSILSLVAAPGSGSYCASKAAGYSLTQAIRGELQKRNILVVGVMPGFVDTDMIKNVAAPKLAPAEVASAIVDAIKNGTEDVFPGVAAQIAAGLRHDPKAVEREFANRVVPRNAN